MIEKLEDLVGKYGVLNSTYSQNCLQVQDMKYHYQLAKIQKVDKECEHPILAYCINDALLLFENEIDILNDNDPIIGLKVGGKFDYRYQEAEILHIDYRYRKMELKFDDGAMIVVDIPKYEVKEVVKVSNKAIKVEKNTQENPDHALHKRLVNEMHETYLLKNADYGNSFVEQHKKFGTLSALIRMDDKMRRLEQLMKNPAHVKDEKMIDTVKDLANYAVMTWMELEKEEKANA